MHVMVQQTLLFGYHSFVQSWGKKLPKRPNASNQPLLHQKLRYGHKSLSACKKRV